MVCTLPQVFLPETAAITMSNDHHVTLGDVYVYQLLFCLCDKIPDRGNWKRNGFFLLRLCGYSPPGWGRQDGRSMKGLVTTVQPVRKWQALSSFPPFILPIQSETKPEGGVRHFGWSRLIFQRSLKIPAQTHPGVPNHAIG